MSYPPLHPASQEQPSRFSSIEEFRRAFAGENEYVEFKAGTGNQPLQDAIVAFSNADGGVILVGVRDDGALVKRDWGQGTLDAITQAFRDTRDPGRYTIRHVDVAGTQIVAVAVARRIDGFAQTSSGRVLARRGSHKVALFGQELRRLLLDRSLERYEEHDSGIPLSAADDQRVSEIARIYGWGEQVDVRERLRERGLLLEGRPNLTIAGAMYLLADPSPALGKAHIEILRYASGGKEYDRRVEIKGPLDRQVADATATVADELGHELVVIGLHRYELPKLPIVVLREALANAVAHRSYEATGTAIRVEIRSDEVRVISPGGLPEPVTEENIRDAQSARNLRIIGVLRQAGLAEDAGRGIDVMLDSMRSELLDPPRFKDLGHAVEVSLSIRSVVTPAERAWVREIEARGLIQPLDRLILVHAARGESITNAYAREILNIDSSEARQALRRLRDAGLLVQHGQTRAATYVLSESISAPAGLRLSRSELSDLLLEMAHDAPLTNESVRQRTGLNRARARRMLQAMVDEGKLVRVGERRGARYLSPGRATAVAHEPSVSRAGPPPGSNPGSERDARSS
jgi:ATP-dependent DNA helicase RecG